MFDLPVRHRPFRTILHKTTDIYSVRPLPTLRFRYHERMRESTRGNQKQPPRLGVHPAVFSAIVIAGFGLFRGVNANAYLSAFAFVESPVLFVPDLFFNVVVACSVVVSSSVAIYLALTDRLKPLSMPFVLPTALLLASNLSAFVGVVLSLPVDLALVFPGLLYGVGSVMLSLFWIEVFAAEKPSVVVTQIALGMLLNVVVSSALSSFSGDIQMRISCALLVVMAGCAWFVRRQMKAVGQAIGGNGNESEDLNTVCAHVAGGLRARWASYRDAFLELSDSLVAFFVLEAVIGLLNSFMVAGSINFEGSGTVSVGAMVGAIIAFCFVVFVSQRIPKVSTVSRVVMPILAAMLVFLPFLSERYNLLFTTLLLASYYFVALQITYLIAEVAHVRRVSSYVLMGVAMGVARVCLAVALLSGYAAAVVGGGPASEGEHTMRYLVIVVVVLYVLCMALVFFSRDRKRRQRMNEGLNDQKTNKGDVGYAVSAREGAETTLEERCAALARKGSLTEREAEILVYLARGRTKSYIANELFVTENTVRSHVRNIYSKLEVHTRQELLDLVELGEPHA